ncbi:MAG: Cof-type HAD-IIB family hydrolase [Acidobacteria bacterium]|nr:Cof-type HAD-IIB family hydrolase [Acidobacteriota bacterium]
MPKKIQLVISDIDGTLITSNHEVTDATKQAAAALYAAGVWLSLSSSRPPRSIVPLARELNLRSPFASFNGALVTTLDGDIKLRSVIAPEIIAQLKTIADDYQLGVWLYDELGWWAAQRDAFVEREAHTSGFEPDLQGYAERLKASVVKLTIVGNPEFVAQAEKRVLTELRDQVSASRSKPRFLDVTPYGFHKGSVVEHLAQVFGVTKDEIAVIGDGPNDIEMFKEAGTSIAMGQGVDEVINAATFITSSNDDEGWSRGIEKYVLKVRQGNGA